MSALCPRQIGGASGAAVLRVVLVIVVGAASFACDSAPEPQAADGGQATPPAASAPPADPTPTATSAGMAPLRVEGARFVDAAGVTFQWRGISAFRLLEMIARGREAEAVRFLDWAAKEQLTVVRVLTMAHNLFPLSPADGRAALPRLLALAAERRLYVEVVVLADTKHIAADLQEHVVEIGSTAAEHPNALVEIANEPIHPTQDARVHDPAFLRRLAGLLPDEVLVAYGSADDSDAHAAGDYVTVHSRRDTDGGGWGHVRVLAETAPLVGRWNKPVISDEPIGAAAEFQAGRRDNDPTRFRAAALATRLAGLGATFHHEGGLYGRTPEGRELECFQAWKEAWTLLPADIEHHGSFGTEADGLLAIGSTDRQVVHRRTDDVAWILLIGPGAEPELAPSEGWTIAEKTALPGVTIVQARRTG